MPERIERGILGYKIILRCWKGDFGFYIQSERLEKKIFVCKRNLKRWKKVLWIVKEASGDVKVSIGKGILACKRSLRTWKRKFK